MRYYDFNRNYSALNQDYLQFSTSRVCSTEWFQWCNNQLHSSFAFTAASMHLSKSNFFLYTNVNSMMYL